MQPVNPTEPSDQKTKEHKLGGRLFLVGCAEHTTGRQTAADAGCGYSMGGVQCMVLGGRSDWLPRRYTEPDKTAGRSPIQCLSGSCLATVEVGSCGSPCFQPSASLVAGLPGGCGGVGRHQMRCRAATLNVIPCFCFCHLNCCANFMMVWQGYSSADEVIKHDT